jgi:hypothetical protein
MNIVLMRSHTGMSTLKLNTLYWTVEHGYPTRGPPDFIMLPAATFMNCVYTINPLGSPGGGRECFYRKYHAAGNGKGALF